MEAEKTEAEVAVTPPKPKKERKPRAAAKPRKSKQLSDVEIHLSDDDEADEPLSPSRVQHDGATVTITGPECLLRVMTLQQQKQFGIKTIAGEMGKKCKKTPVVITFKNPKAALHFFDECLHAETEEAEFIDTGNKVRWYSPTMVISL